MSKNIETMIIDIREQLNLVNPGLIDPANFSESHHEEIEEIHDFVMSKKDFTPSEMNGITEALGALRQPK
ncbi:DUF1128 family protein [Staphylococcus hyicus]|uniref:DUF1128 family protein n=1 Tax=Staphylococcus hyicus TaxID=1284 RepID=A0ACD5FP53_STAHY|nr:DUF1128 family protein [Staphylococcus hyicus]AJC95674.1 hypothetical protein SHYC_04425 [Staphylococcus hyicus]MCE5154773.1 DUF1128 family protein [Staphylococcus hyicus]MCO4329575.1 DUF1128 domain-containing protein [Staphylococcus hyicus]MCO4332075.1 DUF1128 domain-containing protein [Staphylococcus hyicus]MCO4333652.1 DUF1128 domain-containing protein [Staphylococcus hyicus]